MNHLPRPIIDKILSYLKISDRCRFRQVCKKIAKHKPHAEEYLAYIRFLKIKNMFVKENQDYTADTLCICRCESYKTTECDECGIYVCRYCENNFETDGGFFKEYSDEDSCICYFCDTGKGCRFCGGQVSCICYVCKKILCDDHFLLSDNMPVCPNCQI